MRSGVMRTSARSRFPCRMTSWQAAKGIRCVKPSMATVSPSCTYSAMASRSERKRVIGRAPSQVEERGLARALQDDVQPVDDPALDRLAPREQRLAPLGGHALQHRVRRIRGLIGEVEPRG